MNSNIGDSYCRFRESFLPPSYLTRKMVLLVWRQT